MGKRIKDFFLLTAATLLMVAGIYIFKFPNHFCFGGVTGIAIVGSALTNWSAGLITLVLNLSLLLVGFFFLGRQFGIKTVYVSLLLSVGLAAAEKLFPMAAPLTDQPVLELLFAIAVPAVSSAILFNVGASSGGTDIVAMILKKYLHINIGIALMLVDLAITVTACFVFDVETGLYSFCGLFAKTLVIDGAIENINLCKYFTIVCKQPEPICAFIHTELHRTATQFSAIGTYSGENEYVILAVMRRSEAVRLRNFIKQSEPKAFMMITNSSEIIGKGFRGVI